MSIDSLPQMSSRENYLQDIYPTCTHIKSTASRGAQTHHSLSVKVAVDPQASLYTNLNIIILFIFQIFIYIFKTVKLLFPDTEKIPRQILGCK